MSSSYYDSSGKSVTDGEVANASDVNTINTAVDAGFALVESAIDAVDDAVAIPDGGTTGQVLAKASANNQDVEWITDHTTQDGDDISVDTTALTGATVISDLDFNVTTDTEGHVTDANGAVATRELAIVDLDTTATGANLTTLTDGSSATGLHTHTVANLSDTTATAANLNTLTDESVAVDLHKHSYLVAPDGSPNGLYLDNDGKVSLQAGTGITEFSTQGTLAGNSDDAVPTEKAVKTYVDATVLYDAYVKVSHVETSGTGGGTFTTGAWRTRKLNQEDHDVSSVVSLDTNKILLAAGAWRFLISCPASGVGSHQAALNNITQAETIMGTAELAPTGVTTRSIITGLINITASDEIQILHQCETTVNTTGLGEPATMGSEVYTIAEFWREV